MRNGLPLSCVKQVKFTKVDIDDDALLSVVGNHQITGVVRGVTHGDAVNIRSVSEWK